MFSDALVSLNDALKSHLSLFGTVQKVHFDWLQSVAFQLQMYKDSAIARDSALPQDVTHAERACSKQVFQPPENTRPARSLPASSKKFDVSHVRFAKETNDMDGSVPTAMISSGKSYSFNEQFPLRLKEIPLPTEYEMSDDTDFLMSSGVRDEEIYQSNPFEIHGKIIPLWARKEMLDRYYSQKRRVNGDELFRDLPKTCELDRIFGS
jgi:hypothetical protein